jgi:transposase
VLLVMEGMSCRDAARVLNEPTRTVADWVGRFRRLGLEGLKDKAPPGRRSRLSEQQVASIRERLSGSHAHWPGNGRALSELLRREFHVHLEVRQCQRLLKKLLPPR